MLDEIRQVLVSKNALGQIQREMKKVWWTETGGALVGYHDGDVLFVTAASGPGPRAQLRASSVLIDGVHAQKFCDRSLRESAGRDDYVGDWHCHLAIKIVPSETDRVAMQTMSEFSHSPTKTPISLIFSLYTKKFRAYILSPEHRLVSLIAKSGPE